MKVELDNQWIAQQRLRVQGIARPTWSRAEDAVQSLVAVQAQDYLGALWAVGLRLRGATEQTVEQAFTARTIVRTWPMRGTLHFVAAGDVRWLLSLLTPLVVAKHSKRLRNEFDLDEKVFARSRDVFARALEGNRQLSRTAMYDTLQSARIATSGQRGLHILWRLAQDGHICFAAREGKQPTFALLDEWLPPTRRLQRDEALAELARRYFAGHGPATLRDFTWWSGLAPADASIALDLAKPSLESVTIGERLYWLGSVPVRKNAATSRAHLLPSYDEYTVAYHDRGAVLSAQHARRAGNGIFKPTVIVDGRIAGTWSRTLKKSACEIAVSTFDKPQPALKREIEAAAKRYGAFVGLPTVVKGAAG